MSDTRRTFREETATERGDRIQRETAKKLRPVLKRQFELALHMRSKQARDAASGISSVLARREAIEAGLNRDIANAVEALNV